MAPHQSSGPPLPEHLGLVFVLQCIKVRAVWFEMPSGLLNFDRMFVRDDIPSQQKR